MRFDPATFAPLSASDFACTDAEDPFGFDVVVAIATIVQAITRYGLSPFVAFGVLWRGVWRAVYRIMRSLRWDLAATLPIADVRDFEAAASPALALLAKSLSPRAC